MAVNNRDILFDQPAAYGEYVGERLAVASKGLIRNPIALHIGGYLGIFQADAEDFPPF